MTKQEMIEQLISLKENAKSNIDTDEIFRKDYEALEIALKLIDEQETEKRLNNKVIDKRNEENLKLAASNFKKSKIINEMAEHIVSSAIVDDTVCSIKFCGVEEDCTHEKMLKCTKQYFEKKVENDT